MALDRFIHFEDGKCPSFEQVRDVCVHYIGGSGTITSEPPRVFAEVPGVSHSPLARPERFIEVYVDTDNVDVMTREGDEFTNALAEGLTSLIARRFQGKRESDPRENGGSIGPISQCHLETLRQSQLEK